MDELVLGTDGFTVINNKPVGRSVRGYPASKHQVYRYCIALKSMLGPEERRPITPAVRARGSDRIVWSEALDSKTEKIVQHLIKRVHGLLDEINLMKGSTSGHSLTDDQVSTAREYATEHHKISKTEP